MQQNTICAHKLPSCDVFCIVSYSNMKKFLEGKGTEKTKNSEKNRKISLFRISTKKIGCQDGSFDV